MVEYLIEKLNLLCSKAFLFLSEIVIELPCSSKCEETEK